MLSETKRVFKNQHKCWSQDTQWLILNYIKKVAGKGLHSVRMFVMRIIKRQHLVMLLATLVAVAAIDWTCSMLNCNWAVFLTEQCSTRSWLFLCNTALQSKKAESAHSSNKQMLPFGYARQNTILPHELQLINARHCIVVIGGDWWLVQAMLDIIVSLDEKGCICHFTKWQIHPFISKETLYRACYWEMLEMHVFATMQCLTLHLDCNQHIRTRDENVTVLKRSRCLSRSHTPSR